MKGEGKGLACSKLEYAGCGMLLIRNPTDFPNKTPPKKKKKKKTPKTKQLESSTAVIQKRRGHLGAPTGKTLNAHGLGDAPRAINLPSDRRTMGARKGLGW